MIKISSSHKENRSVILDASQTQDYDVVVVVSEEIEGAVSQIATQLEGLESDLNILIHGECLERGGGPGLESVEISEVYDTYIQVKDFVQSHAFLLGLIPILKKIRKYGIRKHKIELRKEKHLYTFRVPRSLTDQECEIAMRRLAETYDQYIGSDDYYVYEFEYNTKRAEWVLENKK